MPDRIDPRTAVRELLETRYRGATAIFLTGSTARIAPTGGELFATTAHSDLDITVVLETATVPYREGFLYKGWPVESLVSAAESLLGVFAEAPALGECSVPSHVVDAIVLPVASAVSDALRQRAKQVIDAGPAPLTLREHRVSRHQITRLVQALEVPRAHEDLIGIGAFLHPRLGQYYLRAANKWSGKPAFLTRRLRAENPAHARTFFAAFHALFARHDPAGVTALVDEILAPYGGRLFDGFRD